MEDILVKETRSCLPIREYHYADATLDATFPHSHIDRAICPSHDSESGTLVIPVISSVGIATLPLEEADSMLLVLQVLSLVGIRFSLSRVLLVSTPLSLTRLHAVLKVASVGGAVAPLVLSKALRLPIDVLADILVAIVEEVASIAMS